MTRATFLVAALTLSVAANATVLFEDDFEGDLSAWTGTGGGAYSGTIVVDPLDASNNVLNFGLLNSAGDTFTSGAAFDPANDTFVLSFRYLGTCGTGDCGGYVGYSDAFPGSHSWHYATGTVSGAADVLIDDGAWHSYEFTFSSARAVHIMLEDFIGSGGVAGDAYFDDFRLTDGIATTVAEPATLGLMGFGLLGIGVSRRRR